MNKNNIKMKKIIALGICLCMAVLVHAQYETTLVVTDAPSTAVKARMEQNGTKLLTELNNAQGENQIYLWLELTSIIRLLNL